MAFTWDVSLGHWGPTHETRASEHIVSQPLSCCVECAASLYFFLPRHASDNHSCVRTKHDEMMSIFFTSGTSGSPKMTGHTHSSFGLGLSVNGRYCHRTAARSVNTVEVTTHLLVF